MAIRKNKNSKRIFVFAASIIGLLAIFSLIFLLKYTNFEELTTSISQISRLKKVSFATFDSNFQELISDLKITEQNLPSGLEKITESILPNFNISATTEKIISNIKKTEQVKSEKLALSTSEPCINLQGVMDIPLNEIPEVHTSLNFLICYAKSGPHAVSTADKNNDSIPDYVLDIASEAEKAYRYMKELETAGVTLPLPIKDGRYEILLFNLGQYAGTVALGYGDDAGKKLIVMDNNMTSDLSKFFTHFFIHGTITHTYPIPTYVGMDFYNLFQTLSWLTANSWIMPRFAEPWRHLEDDGNPTAGISDVSIGSFLFYQYLAEKTNKGNDIIPAIYQLQIENNLTSLEAVHRFLSENGITWEQALSEYHVWNLLTGPYALISNEGYDFAKKIWTIYGSVKPSQIHRIFPVTGRRSPNEPRGTGAEYLKFVTKDIQTKSDLEVIIQPQADVSLVVSIVGIKKDLTVNTSYKGLVMFPQTLTAENAQDYLYIYYVIANPSKDENNIGNYTYEASLKQQRTSQIDIQKSSLLQGAIGNNFTNLKNTDLAVQKFESNQGKDDLFDQAVLFLMKNLDSSTMSKVISAIKQVVEKYGENMKKCKDANDFSDGCFYANKNYSLLEEEVINPLINALDTASAVVSESANKEEDMKKILTDIEDIKNKYLAINGKIGFDANEIYKENAQNFLHEVTSDDPSAKTLEKALRMAYDKADKEYNKLEKSTCNWWEAPSSSYCFYSQLSNNLFWSIDMSAGYDAETEDGFTGYVSQALNEFTIASQLLDTIRMTIGNNNALEYPDVSVNSFTKTYQDAFSAFKNGYDHLLTTFNFMHKGLGGGGDSFFSEMKGVSNLLIVDEYRNFWGEADWTNEKKTFADFMPVLEEVLENRTVLSPESLEAYSAFQEALEALRNAKTLEELENALAALAGVDKQLLFDYFYQLPNKNEMEQLLHALKTFNSAMPL